MNSDVVVISADATLREAAKIMASSDVGMLPVQDCGVLVGVITDRDITVRATARGGNAGRRRVREIMTPGVFHCFDDNDATTAAELMEKKQVRRLAVLNRDSGLVGIVSLENLAVHADGECLACEVIHALAQPALQHDCPASAISVEESS
jgi:CBS domain-containing protein